MATSSDNMNECPAILRPGTPEYKSALELLYGKPGVPEGFSAFPEPVTSFKLDKEKIVAAKTGSIDTDQKINVLMFRDHVLNFPELWLNVLIVGPPEDTRGFNHLFARGSCKKASCIEDADLVVFTGGPDVDPALYGEEPHSSCYVDVERDYSDIGTYFACVDQGVPMVGVCRGAQFLAVMNKHKLFQEIDNHQHEHKMYCHRTKMMVDRVSSRHHQCVRPMPDGAHLELIGWSNISTQKYLNDKKFIEARQHDSPLLDVEAFFIRDTCCFGVQGHPEYKGYNAFALWFLDSIYHLIYLNSDLEWQEKGHRLRMKPDILAERKFFKPELGEKQREVLTIAEGVK